VLPFIFFDLIVLVFLIIFPELATWLPKTMIAG
jgi:TRAP-type mannitol/chloroaromatic compound transport system permease large subunit